jgi:hypothetical protein
MSHSWGYDLFFFICDNRKVLGEESAARLVAMMGFIRLHSFL